MLILKECVAMLYKTTVGLCWAMAAMHDQPSNNVFVKKREKINKTKANENAKAAQFALFLH